MVYVEDPLNRIVNVSWSGAGILLEFVLFDFWPFVENYDIDTCPAGVEQVVTGERPYFTSWRVKAGEDTTGLQWNGKITGNTSGAVLDYAGLGVCISPDDGSTLWYLDKTSYWIGQGYEASGEFEWSVVGRGSTYAGPTLGFQSGEECTYEW